MDRRTFVGLTAAAAVRPPLPRAAFAQTSPQANNVVLVHGLFADGSSWTEVIPRLLAAGLNVTSVQNPLTTLTEAVEAALRVLTRQNGATVLAGYSFSGMIVTDAGVHPNVSASSMWPRARRMPVKITRPWPSSFPHRRLPPASCSMAMKDAS